MERRNARQVLQALVQGRDPRTGDELPADTVLQHAEVIRALLAGVAALEAVAARARRRAHLPANVGRAWSETEEQSLTVAFRSGEKIDAIAARHQRTLTAVEARLERLGLLTPQQRVTRSRFIARDHARAENAPEESARAQDATGRQFTSG